MKVLIFSTAYEPMVGGAELAVRNITDRLSSCEFDLITARFDRKLSAFEVINNVRVHRLGIGHPIDKWLILFFGLFKGMMISPDLIWGMDLSQGSVAAAILKVFKFSIPFLFTVQYGYGEDRIKNGRSGMIALAFKFILKEADRVTVISESLKRVVVGYGYKKQIDLIPNGVDLAKFSPVKMADESENFQQRRDILKIITTSRLVYKNGIDILIKAAAELKDQIKNRRFLIQIIGSGPDEKSLKKLARKIRVDESVVFLGQVHPDIIPDYLVDADIFVRPSRSEGLGNSFLEAMAVGLPVIGTEVGGIPDFLRDQDNGLFVKVNDPFDLAKKLKILADDEAMRKVLGQSGKRLVIEKYNWENISRDIYNVFNSMMKQQ